MTKLKSPIMSLGASGSVSDSITFLKRQGIDIAEKKPELPYFKTLPVQYQRWLYEDYAYLWTQQSAATKQSYQSSGVRHHLTGFQYWMKYQLTNLPDIAGYWKLDTGSLPTARDSSRNSNHATITGGTPSTGVIDGAIYFDGTNDFGRVTNSPSLTNFTELTIVFTIRTAVRPGASWRTYLYLGYWQGDGFHAIISDTKQTVDFTLRTSAPPLSRPVTAPFIPNTLTRVGMTWDGAVMTAYSNGTPGATIAFTGTLVPTVDLFFTRRQAASHHGDGILDHIIIYNRALDAAEMLRDSERRWP